MKLDVKKIMRFAVKAAPVVIPIVKKFLNNKKKMPTTRR